MNNWLHRIAHLPNVSYPLLQCGYLSIGFSDFTDATFLDRVSNTDWEWFEQQFDEVWGRRPRTRFALWRFIAEMDGGDRVIVPSWGTFSVYEIMEPMASLISDIALPADIHAWDGRRILATDGFLQLEGESEPLDLGFARKVQPIAEGISRYDYADSALTSRMKIRTTNANINDVERNVEKAIAAFRAEAPINLRSQLADRSAAPWLEAVVAELNDSKFEKLVKWYFERVGATEVSIPNRSSQEKSGDVDVVAIFDAIRTIIHVQVKFHRGETSAWAIRQIDEYSRSRQGMDDGYQRQYWVVSSSDGFSDRAIRLAAEKNVLLIDGRQFMRMVMDAGIDGLDLA